MPGPEAGNRTVIGDHVAGQPAVGQLFLAGPGDLSRRAPSLAVGVDQNGEHHRRIVGRTPLGSIGKVKGRKIHLLYDIPDESDHVIYGDPLVHGRRQEEQLISITGDETATHTKPPNLI